MSNNSGISLIEIMVVVAIVGILTSIAIPSYSKLVVKAKATELLTTANAYKLDLFELDLNNPRQPFNQTFLAPTANIEQISILAAGQDATRRYEINVRSNIATPNGDLQLQLLGFPANGIVSWECRAPAELLVYLPKNCRAAT
jgi:type IV pilus assembly protein PilA